MSQIIIVYNPSAGGGKGSKEKIQQAFGNAAENLQFIEISDTIRQDIQDAAERDETILVAAGGDGTVNAVAQAAVKLGLPMGVLPVGTLNHFAKDLQIPLDLGQAAAIITKANIQQIDYCTVNDRIFVNNSSVGMYPMIVQQRDELADAVGKWPAAFVATVKAALRIRTDHLELRLPDTSYKFKTPLLFVGNSSYEFEKVGFTNRQHLTDGKLFIYVVRANRVTSVLRLMIAGFFGKRTKHRDFLDERHTRLEVASHKRALDVAVDGEVVTLQTPLVYEVHPARLAVCSP